MRVQRTHLVTARYHTVAGVPGLSCESCNARRCGYSVRYTEGSSIRGHILYDHAHFKREARGGGGGGGGEGGGALERATSRIYFGCQTQETGMFFKQQADGIIGLQRSHTRSKVPPSLYQRHSLVHITLGPSL